MRLSARTGIFCRCKIAASACSDIIARSIGNSNALFEQSGESAVVAQALVRVRVKGSRVGFVDGGAASPGRAWPFLADSQQRAEHGPAGSLPLRVVVLVSPSTSLIVSTAQKILLKILGVPEFFGCPGVFRERVVCLSIGHLRPRIREPKVARLLPRWLRGSFCFGLGG